MKKPTTFREFPVVMGARISYWGALVTSVIAAVAWRIG